MKKIVSALLIVGFSASAATAAPSYIKRDGARGYNVTYDYKDKEKSGWYAAIRAQLNLLNWKNTYYSDWVGYNGNDEYSFKPVFGGSAAAGRRFEYFWRAEVEAGYTGLFSDEGQGISFNFSAPYVLANIYYDFNGGLYLGAGLGAAAPIMVLEGDIFLPGGRVKTSVSPMAGLMAGYSRKLDDNIALDLRYRIAGWSGAKQTRHFTDNPVTTTFYLENKIGLVLENSFSVGLRYEF
jgi:opacity protein-like surface antigen